MDVLRKCKELTGRSSIDGFMPEPGIIPEVHLAAYARIAAAKDLGKEMPNSFAAAALARVALAQDEDDRVRVECVQQLLNSNFTGLELVLLALLFDEDDLMIVTAIEGLVLTHSPLLATVSSLLANSTSKSVRETAMRDLPNGDILLYHLDPPARCENSAHDP